MTNTTDTQTTDTLSCGHAPTKTAGIGTGYAILPDGSRVCYACADRMERERLITDDSIVAYVSDAGGYITTWSGGELLKVTHFGSARTGFYGSKVYFVQAVAPDGSRWYGRNGGEGMVIKMKRAKR